MLYVAQQLIEGRVERIEELAESDPFNVMDMPLGNYRGVMTAAGIEAADAGQWFYDSAANELVYKVVNSDYIRTDDGTGLIKVKMILDYDDRNNNGSYEHDIDRPRGVSLRVMNRYQWSY
jgi:hypothetical protein